METALVLLVVQGVLGAFDTVYFHEYKLRLPQVRTARREVHGIHGHGQLQQFLGRISLPALDADGSFDWFTAYFGNNVNNALLISVWAILLGGNYPQAIPLSAIA